MAVERAISRPDPALIDHLEDTLAYARANEYVGWDYWDGLSSRVLQALPVEHKWLNLVVQEGIKRAPVNVRPLFLVEQAESPVGLALFTLANHGAYAITGRERYRTEAEALADRVTDHGTRYGEPFSLYHNHPIQDLDRKKPRGTPRIVATVFGVAALLASTESGEARADIAHSAYRFVTDELDPVADASGGRKIKYTPVDAPTNFTINANALAARMLGDLYRDRPADRYEDLATDLLTFVADRQQPAGGWMYSDPPGASHLSMDNHHNGYIVESFLRYRDVFDANAFENTLQDGLTFYRHTLFEDNGAPNWDESSSFPRDITAAAQGIIVFSLAGEHEFARRILDWTFEHLYAGDGRFFYQRRRFYTKRFTLMRWCTAWMAIALSTYLTTLTHETPF